MPDTPSFSRKDLKAPDAFFEGAGRLNRYVAKNRGRIVFGALGVIALLVAGFGSASYISAAKARDAAAFERARASLEAESFAAARTGLDALANGGSGVYRELAGFYSADLALRQGRLEEAVQAYEAFETHAPTDYLRQAAINSRAHALERAERVGEALQAYGQAADIDGPYRQAALRSQARLAELSGQKEQARAALERLLELYPGSSDTESLAGRLAELSQ